MAPNLKNPGRDPSCRGGRKRVGRRKVDSQSRRGDGSWGADRNMDDNRSGSGSRSRHREHSGGDNGGRRADRNRDDNRNSRDSRV